MNQTAAVWLLILLAFVAANLPFINERIFAVWQPKRILTQKFFWLRALELVLLYFLVGTLGVAFERLIGNVFSQRWEFYAITFSLFVVMAFPGFVYRYLLRRN
ncbi:MAG: DUF2818 family protein [Alcaligenaceae bacterium]|jgi:hypothetical protein